MQIDKDILAILESDNASIAEAKGMQEFYSLKDSLLTAFHKFENLEDPQECIYALNSVQTIANNLSRFCTNQFKQLKQFMLRQEKATAKLQADYTSWEFWHAVDVLLPIGPIASNNVAIKEGHLIIDNNYVYFDIDLQAISDTSNVSCSYTDVIPFSNKAKDQMIQLNLTSSEACAKSIRNALEPEKLKTIRKMCYR